MASMGKGSQAAMDAQLIDAAIADDIGKVRSLIARGACAKAADPAGFTALMWAARYDLPRVVEALLLHSDLEQRSADGRDALEIAKGGAGPASLSAIYLDTHRRAQVELAALAAQVQESRKPTPPKFRL